MARYRNSDKDKLTYRFVTHEFDPGGPSSWEAYGPDHIDLQWIAYQGRDFGEWMYDNLTAAFVDQVYASLAREYRKTGIE